MTRLSQDRINAIVAANASAYVEPEGLAMALEIQQRRAHDLTPDEIETVREMLVEFEANDSAWEGGCGDVIALCRKLLVASGEAP